MEQIRQMVSVNQSLKQEEVFAHLMDDLESNPMGADPLNPNSDFVFTNTNLQTNGNNQQPQLKVMGGRVYKPLNVRQHAFMGSENANY